MVQQEISQKDVAIETALLKAMSRRYNFETYNSTINTKRIYPATEVLLKDYAKYFKLYEEHKEVDFELFYTQFSQSWHNDDLDNEDITYYRDWVLPAIEKADSLEVETSLMGLIQKQALEEINKSALKTFDIEKISSILDIYRSKSDQLQTENENDCKTSDNIDYDVLNDAKGIPHFLPAMQEAIGAFAPGQFIGINSDTSGGKSAYCICQAVEAFKHVHDDETLGPILYFNSEMTDAELFIRFLSNLYKDKIPGGFEAIVRNREKVVESFEKKYNKDALKIYQLTGHDISYVKAKINKHKPSLVIIDLVDALTADQSTIMLKQLWESLRLTANAGYAVLGTTQSGDTNYFDTEDNTYKKKKHLTESDVYGSKQKSAAVYALIGIGQDKDSSVRYVDVIKKKRGNFVQIKTELEDIYSNFKPFEW
jgi:hypothetical protein